MVNKVVSRKVVKNSVVVFVVGFVDLDIVVLSFELVEEAKAIDWLAFELVDLFNIKIVVEIKDFVVSLVIIKDLVDVKVLIVINLVAEVVVGVCFVDLIAVIGIVVSDIDVVEMAV